MGLVKKFGPVWFIQGTNRGKYPYCNSVYIEGPGIIIDPASDREELAKIKEGPGVKEVWLSHWHEDHFMYMDMFEGVPFRLTEIETPPLQDPEVFMDWYGIEEPLFRDYWRKALVEQFNYRPRTPDTYFQPGETIEAGGLEIDVIHVPGHTPGSLAFFIKGPDVIFMADYDLGKFGPWYGDRDSDIDHTIESVNRLREVPAKVWTTGHEDGLFEQQPGEAWDRYLGVIDQREAKLMDYITEPRTMDDIVEQWIVYRKPREPRGFFEYGERALMGKHLERLIKKGEVRQVRGAYVKA